MGMKFIRGMVFPNPNSNGRGVAWRLKWMYEFWGFCINGTSDVLNPGGFASNNGINFPINFTNGTSLMASGIDGSHNAVTGDQVSGECVFTATSSAPFTRAMQGMCLVMWKPNSNSSEDSIYFISRVISSSQIVIATNTGGFPNPVTKHPAMSARTNVCYRVVDMVTGSDAGRIPGSFLVFQTDAGSINPGQGNSQIQFTHGFNSGGNERADLLIALSGSGSWNGQTLAVTDASNTTPIQITTATPHNLTTGQTVSISGVGGNQAANGSWSISVNGTNTFTLSTGDNVNISGSGTYTSGGTVYNGFQNDGYQATYTVPVFKSASYDAGKTSVNMIGDKTFLIAHLKENDLSQRNLHLNIHFEIPQRLYQTQQDLHPVAILTETVFTGSLFTSSPSASYGGGFVMRTHTSDSVTARKYRTLVKALRGDGLPDVFGQNLTNYNLGYNTIAGTIPISDGLLCLPGVPTQFALSRVRLRTVKFTGTHVPPYHRIGLNGEFIQIQNGICWPWDNTIIPQQLLPFGSG